MIISLKQVDTVMGQYTSTSMVTINKTYNRFTKKNNNNNNNNKRKELKYTTKENHQTAKGKTKRRKENWKNQLENKGNDGNKYIPINNCFKCQWTKFSNKKTE